MSFNDQSEFGKAYRAHCIDDAQQIHAAFEADQLAEDEAPINLEQAKVYLHPDGEHFELAALCGNGGCVTTTGRVIPASEWVQCEVLNVGSGFRR